MSVFASFRRIDPAVVVILAGVCAALHVGKLPPALPVLRDDLGISLVEAGFLLSAVQVAGMTLGLAVGSMVDGLGLRRCMLAGLVVLAVASAAGAETRSSAWLLGLRGVEGFGFLLTAMPAPSLIRRLVAPRRLSSMLGAWGGYMPFGTALALLGGPWVMGWSGWPAWWWLLAALSAGMAWWLWRAVPDDRAGVAPAAHAPGPGWRARLGLTLRHPGPWLLSLAFGAYSCQWLAVIGFLPSVYAQAGLSGRVAGALTALAALVNIVGNVAAGRLLQRGVPAHRLLYAGFTVMGLATVAAFAGAGEGGLPAAGRYAAVVLFSMCGGMVPGSLFALSVRVAPVPATVSTTVGWMQQWSSVGQFAGPPLVAWLAAAVGGWHWTWLITAGCALFGLLLTGRIRRLLATPG